MPDLHEPSKPEKIGEYVAWLRKEFDCEPRDVLRSRYDAQSSKALLDVSNSVPWTTLLGELRDYNDRYLLQTGYHLFVTQDPPGLVRKEFPSFFLKTFRQNVTANARWPESPENGWRIPGNWLVMINDIVRTTVIVKYLDGVTDLVERLQALFASVGVFSRVDYEAKETGYYAAHMYFYTPVEVASADWGTETVNLSVEIQVTTQLQEVIRRLTHANYEKTRNNVAAPGLKWQWDYASPEFTPNYLAHILHYVEGMIMEVRTRPAVDGGHGEA